MKLRLNLISNFFMKLFFPRSHTKFHEERRLSLSFSAAFAALEFSHRFSTHGARYLFLVALGTIEFIRRYATRSFFPHYPALKRRAKNIRRYAAKNRLSTSEKRAPLLLTSRFLRVPLWAVKSVFKFA